MLDILARSIARAAGVETPDDLRIIEPAAPHRSVVRRLFQAFERWNVRRSTYLTLKHLDDRLLRDIGLHRGILYDVAQNLGRRAAANDNELPVALSHLAAANDNSTRVNTECV